MLQLPVRHHQTEHPSQALFFGGNTSALFGEASDGRGHLSTLTQSSSIQGAQSCLRRDVYIRKAAQKKQNNAPANIRFWCLGWHSAASEPREHACIRAPPMLFGPNRRQTSPQPPCGQSYHPRSWRAMRGKWPVVESEKKLEK